MQIKSSSGFPFSVLSFATLLLSTLADHDHLEEQRRDRIIKLPGQPPNASFSQFSGYITVDPLEGRAFFYWLIEAPKTVKTRCKPLVLWLDCGPGCSSVANGASEEVDPFRVRPDGKTLYLNPNAWSQAGDAYRFLINWLERYPQYKHRPFYIAGESYAGHYIPELSQIIARRNNGVKNPVINFIGFLLGNPLIDDYHDNTGTYEFWWSHGLISDSTYEDLKKFCPNNTFLFPRNECHGALERAYSELGDINPYSIYYTKRYMNRPEVQRALHANITRIPHPWVPCSSIVRSNWSDSPKSMLPIFKELIAAGSRIWVFSGDADATLPLTATRYSINALQLETSISWHAWYDDHQQVGGWSQVYKGLTYVTVKGAGRHEVPLTQPRLALMLFRQFLKNEPMPALQSS